MKSGTRIIYHYKHPKHSGKFMSKEGEYIGLIRHTYKHKGPQLAVVKLDGNKRVSRVPLQGVSAAQHSVQSDQGYAPTKTESSVSWSDPVSRGESNPTLGS